MVRRPGALVREACSEVPAISKHAVEEGDDDEKIADDERDCTLYTFELFIIAWVDERGSIQEREERGARTLISAVNPVAKMSWETRYAVCTALTTLTKILVEKTERTMILWFEGNFKPHSKRSGRATRMTSDNASAEQQDEQARDTGRAVDKRTADL